MSGFASPVDVRVVHAGILASAEHLDTMIRGVLTPLGFSNDPLLWPTEVERVLTDLAGSARLAALQQICAAAQFFHDRQLEKETSDRLAMMVYRGTAFGTTLELLTGMASTDSERFDSEFLDPECRNIIRSNLPELNATSTAFTADLAVLKAMQEELKPSYAMLAMPQVDLEPGLNAWLRVKVPGELVVTGKVALLQLKMLADKRRAVVDHAATLLSDMTSAYASSTAKDQDRACNDLRGLARALALQVRSQRLHLSAIVNIARTVRSEFPALHVRGSEVAVRDLLGVRYKHSVFEGRLAAMTERSDQMRLMSGCMMNILNLDLDLRSFKRSSAS